MALRCDECGQYNDGPAKHCTRCGESLEPEFLMLLRREIPVSLAPLVYAIVIGLIAFGIAFGVVWSSRHYTWTEDIESTVTDKRHESRIIAQVCTLYSEDGFCLIYTPIYADYWVLVLADGKTLDVPRQEYDTTQIGDNRTYVKSHTDWIPGMENLPWPAWIFATPIGIAGAIVGIFYGSAYAHRIMEWQEFVKKGQLSVEPLGEKIQLVKDPRP